MRDAIQKIAVEMPAYGHRRITAELRRGDWVVNRKRVLRIMREDNLVYVTWFSGGLRVVDMGNLVGSGDANGIAVITQLAPIDVEWDANK